MHIGGKMRSEDMFMRTTVLFEDGLSAVFCDGSPLSEEPARVEITEGCNSPTVMEARIERGQGADGKQYPFVKFRQAEPAATPDESRGA